MDSEREKTPATGVFDKKTEDGRKDIQEGNPGAAPPKKDFKDPFLEQQEEVKFREKSQTPGMGSASDNAAQQTAQALNQSGPGKNVQADLDDMNKVSPEDLKLAEEIIFNGFAEFNLTMPNLPKIKLTICSTSAEEMSMIDEIVFDMVNAAEGKEDGTVDIPQNHITATRNALLVALSYRGKNNQELMREPRYHLQTIKNAIMKISELYNTGELENADKLKKDLKKALIIRSTAIKRMPTPLIDFLSGEKYSFDVKMNSIMSTKQVLPKS